MGKKCVSFFKEGKKFYSFNLLANTHFTTDHSLSYQQGLLTLNPLFELPPPIYVLLSHNTTNIFSSLL